jgi:hypothetical protein
MVWVSYVTLKDGYRHKLIERALRRRVRLFTSEYIRDLRIITPTQFGRRLLVET